MVSIFMSIIYLMCIIIIFFTVPSYNKFISQDSTMKVRLMMYYYTVLVLWQCWGR